MSRTKWHTLWNELDNHKRLPLGEYVAKCDEIKAKWHRQFPKFQFSNRRYVAHLEDALQLGADVNHDDIATVTDHELRFDAPAFPLLLKARRDANTEFQRKRENPALREFREVYGDCIIDPGDPGFDKAMEGRTLQWLGDRLSLIDAAWWYSQIPDCEGYKSCVLPGLLAEFRDDGITVTPSRAYSTCMFLHVPRLNGDVTDSPGYLQLRKQIEEFVRETFGADEVDWQKDESLRIWWD